MTADELAPNELKWERERKEANYIKENLLIKESIIVIKSKKGEEQIVPF